MMKPNLAAPLLLGFALYATGSAFAEDTNQTPPWDQADAIYGEDAMADARRDVLAEGGDQKSFYILFNQLEAQMSEMRRDGKRSLVACVDHPITMACSHELPSPPERTRGSSGGSVSS